MSHQRITRIQISLSRNLVIVFLKRMIAIARDVAKTIVVRWRKITGCSAHIASDVNHRNISIFVKGFNINNKYKFFLVNHLTRAAVPTNPSMSGGMTLVKRIVFFKNVFIFLMYWYNSFINVSNTFLYFVISFIFKVI